MYSLGIISIPKLVFKTAPLV